MEQQYAYAYRDLEENYNIWEMVKCISLRFFLAEGIVADILFRIEKRHFLRIIFLPFPSVENYKFVRLYTPPRSLLSALLQLVLPVRLNTFRVAEAAERFLTFSLSHGSRVQNLNRRFSSAVTHRGGLKAARSFPALSPLPPTCSRGTPYSGCFFVPTCTISNCR